MSRIPDRAMNNSTFMRPFPSFPFPARPNGAIVSASLIAVLTLSYVASAQAAGITDLGGLNGGATSAASGVSADGTVVIGTAYDAVADLERGFRWTAAGGMQHMGDLNGGGWSWANGVSADGSVVVGGAVDGLSGLDSAFRWTEAEGMVSLGELNNGGYSWAMGVSADGTTVVGEALDGAHGFDSRAFRWTEADGMVSLGTLNGGAVSVATGVSGNGGVVTGTATDGAAGNAGRAFRWTEADGMQSLGTLNGGTWANGTGVSADGTVLIGYARDGASGNDWRGFRWMEAIGMVSLGTLNGGDWSTANGVSANGSVIVGSARDGASGNAERAFRWTETGGMQSVESWLATSGIAVAADLQTSIANGTNSDGSVVAGELANGHAFIARVTGDGGGLVTLDDLQASLAATASGAAMILRSNDLLINGSHSRPLSRRIDGGRSTFWMTGDWGRDDHRSREGDLGLAEFGLGHNFGPVQINVAVGRTWGEQNLLQNGSADTAGTFVLGEALMPLSRNVWVTLGAYKSQSGADMKRGYLNAGIQDYSSGSTDVDSWGLRARLDLDKAYNLASTDLSPFLDVTYSEARMGGYTETGGGFPARFDGRKDKATDLRVGVNLERPIRDDVSIVGTLEATHRFEKGGARTRGDVTGMFGFDVAGAESKQNWLRAGVGVEGRIADGTASVMLNTSTEGDMPSHWLAVRWQQTF